MTRINSAISVKHLTDEHLLAEHREIKRLPHFVHKLKDIKKIPKSFVLGIGHVSFFLNKMKFIASRYDEIYKECLNRGFNVTYYGDNFQGIPNRLFNDYKPTKEEQSLLIERIIDRLNNSSKKSWHYYGKPIDKVAAIKILKTQLI